MKILETERLVLRIITSDDAAFYLRLVNEPSWLQYIGNRGVHTLEQACLAISQGPTSMFERFGFCLYLVELKSDATPIGLCGLIKRETLNDVDIGFAFLPEYWGQGYAYESAFAVTEHGRNKIGLKRLVAIVAPDNSSSIRLIERLGMTFEKMVELTAGNPPTLLYGRHFDVSNIV